MQLPKNPPYSTRPNKKNKKVPKNLRYVYTFGFTRKKLLFRSMQNYLFVYKVVKFNDNFLITGGSNVNLAEFL